jgi:hypothetical protein
MPHVPVRVSPFPGPVSGHPQALTWAGIQRAEHEAKTIGIVLCSEKNDAMAQITLPDNNERILAARYQMFLADRRGASRRTGGHAF